MRVTQAVVLAGGRGSRLGALTDSVPKPALDVGGKPFIEYLLQGLWRQGIRSVALSVGYLADAIMDVVERRHDRSLSIRYAIESEPMGTAGGARLAWEMLDLSKPCFIVNGDTLFDANLRIMEDTVSTAGACAGIIVRTVPQSEKYGSIEIDENGYIVSFREKGESGPGMINGGIYYCTPEVFSMIPKEKSSLEDDLFPELIQRRMIKAYESDAFFLDIGSPENFQLAQSLLPQWENGAKHPLHLR